MRVESNTPAGKVKGKGWIHKMTESIPVSRPPRKAEPKPDVEHWTRLAQECFQRDGAVVLREQLSTELGVSVDALTRLGVGLWFDDYRKLTCSTWPERRQGGKVVGIVRRYRVAVNEGGNKLAMKGGSQGLYLPRDWWRSSGPVLIPEGGSDTAALTTLGIGAIGRPSNVGGINALIGVLCRVQRPIIVLGERDFKPDRIGAAGCKGSACDGCPQCYPGRYGARVTSDALRAALPRKSRVLMKMPPRGAKDVRSWLNSTPEATAAVLLRRLEDR
jgi:hypothetical protein